MRRLLAGLLVLALAGCGARSGPPTTTITVQRFFGECGAVYGHSTDPAKADTECGILTTLLNRFEAENPDIRLDINIVAWPGYPTLTAQIAAHDPPDLVIMHQSVIADYAERGLIEPMEGVLARAGVPLAAFTPAAQRGVVKRGHAWGLPLDTIGGLFHINTALMAKAGLMRGGQPVLPHSPVELLAQARRFKAATGLPYLIQVEVTDPATPVRNLYTYLLAQDAAVFPDARTIHLDTPAARRVMGLFKQLNDEGLSTRGQDFPAANSAFLAGRGGIFPTGTWMIGGYDHEAATPGRSLYRHYSVLPYPVLWGHAAPFVDGHAWVMPTRARSPAAQAAIVRLIAFLARHDGDWARTGHLPAVAAVLATTAFRDLPHRADLAPLTSTGAQLPGYVRRQSAVQDIVGEELELALAGSKPVAAALADAERRVNAFYAELPPA